MGAAQLCAEAAVVDVVVIGWWRSYRASMGTPSEHDQRLRDLSADDRAAMVSELHSALEQSHAALALVCKQLMREHGLSYEGLRTLMEGSLPDYLAGVSASAPSSGARSPAVRLTDEQAATLPATYRELLLGPRRNVTTRQLLTGYAVDYGVPLHSLQGLVLADRRRHPAEYRALEHLGAEVNGQPERTPKRAKRRAAKKPKPHPLDGKPADVSVVEYFARSTYCPKCHRDFDSNFVPVHAVGANRCQGSERFAVSLYTIHLQKRGDPAPRGGFRGPTVSGGLPGLGRRGRR